MGILSGIFGGGNRNPAKGNAKGFHDGGPYGRPDRISTNSDGTKFYGHDNGDGTTTWYNKDGTADCQTKTPSNDD